MDTENKNSLLSVKARLLLVDDEETILFFLEKLFQENSYLVETRSSAKEALELLSREEFDILITDIRMPAMDGIELLKKAKELQPQLEGMIISGHDDIDSAIAALKLGAVNYFRKPLNFDEILLGVSRCLEKRKLQKEIKQKDACFRAFIDNSSSLISIKDVKGRYLMINKRLEDLFHVTSGEVMNKTAFEAFSNMQAVALSAYDFDVLEYNTSHKFETTIDIDGKERFFVVNKFPIRLFNSDTVYAIGTLGTDITDIIDVRENLKSAEERYRTYVNSSIDGFFLTDLEGRFLEVNEAYCRMIGYSCEEFLQLSAYDIEAVQTPEEIKSRIKKIHEQGYERFETMHRHKTGRLIDVSVSCNFNPVFPDVFFVFVRDISEQKKIQRELQISREHLEKRVAERSNELERTYQQLLHATKLSSIGKLTSSIAHEFNNPLNGIQSVFEGIKLSDSLGENDLKMVNMALDECDRLKTLIQSLQDFNKPTPGVQEDIDIHKLIADVIALCEKDLLKSNVTVLKEFSDKIPLVKVVPDQVKQVLLNLLNNARDALQGKEGRVLIRTELRDEHIALHVHDTGSGITPGAMEHIFEPFYSTKPQVKGTGLGLSISYGIIKNHGGDINVASSPGNGTTFSVILPVNNYEMQVA
ncbi:MAG: PAS domain S-box protein [Desulfobulbaceae bacterium]|nr:PAS domain S-box protein [Desulfobulbaceae bacterium]